VRNRDLIAVLLNVNCSVDDGYKATHQRGQHICAQNQCPGVLVLVVVLGLVSSGFGAPKPHAETQRAQRGKPVIILHSLRPLRLCERISGNGLFQSNPLPEGGFPPNLNPSVTDPVRAEAQSSRRDAECAERGSPKIILMLCVLCVLCASAGEFRVTDYFKAAHYPKAAPSQS